MLILEYISTNVSVVDLNERNLIRNTCRRPLCLLCKANQKYMSAPG